MGFLGRLIAGFFEAKTPEFARKASILGYIHMCESWYNEVSRAFPNRDPHEYLVGICNRIKVKSGVVRESDLDEPSIVWDTLLTTLKPACLPPPICARALAYTFILRDDTLLPDFVIEDDYRTYYDEYERYLEPLQKADNDILRDLYCKYNKNVEYQQAMFGKDYFNRETGISTETARTEAGFSQKAEDYADYFDRGLAYGKAGKHNQAIEDFNRAIELNPQAAAAYNNRGLAYYNLGNYEQAIKDCDMALQINPEEAEAYYNRGLVHADLDNYTEAIEDYYKAIELNRKYADGLNPKLAEAYNDRGATYDNLGQYQRAIEDYNEGIRLKPDDAYAYYNRGSAYSKLGQDQRAIKDYDEAIRLKPDFAEFYVFRGGTYSILDQYQRAIEDYNEAIRLKPDYVDAYYNRGLAYANLGQYQRAIEDYNEPSAETGLPRPTTTGELAYAKLGQHQRAIEDYNEAIRLKPDYTMAYYNRGNAYNQPWSVSTCHRGLSAKPSA